MLSGHFRWESAHLIGLSGTNFNGVVRKDGLCVAMLVYRLNILYCLQAGSVGFH